MLGIVLAIVAVIILALAGGTALLIVCGGSDLSRAEEQERREAK
jgi:hypothetical protein